MVMVFALGKKPCTMSKGTKLNMALK